MVAVIHGIISGWLVFVNSMMALAWDGERIAGGFQSIFGVSMLSAGLDLVNPHLLAIEHNVRIWERIERLDH